MTFEEWLQSRLTAHGFSVGPIDGIIGPDTIAAIKAFEAKHNLPADGTADQAVVKALRASSSFVPPRDMLKIPDRNNDVPVENSRNRWPRQRAVSTYYGEVGANQVRVEIPFDMYLAWDKGRRISKMTLHRRVAGSAEVCLNKIADTYSAKERKDLGLHLFGGSLNVRRMRGGTRYSMHSWGIAIDFDPERNRLKWKKPRARLSHDDAVPFWKIWEAEGWVSLGRVRDFDWMHVQAARL